MSRSPRLALRPRTASLVLSALAACGLALATADPAEATPIGAPLIPGNTADIKWTACVGTACASALGLGTSSITLDGVGTATLTLSVIQTLTAADSLSGIFGALGWDQDLANELNGPGTLVAPAVPGFALMMQSTAGYNDPMIVPATLDSTGPGGGAVSGYALGLDIINLGAGAMIAGPSGMTFTAFTVAFVVNPANVATDGNDILWGAFGTGNAIGTDGGATIYTSANSPWAGAAVNLIPEPATVSLIALGCASLAIAGRRRKEPRQ